jgi:hypothetical protein
MPRLDGVRLEEISLSSRGDLPVMLQPAALADKTVAGPSQNALSSDNEVHPANYEREEIAE